MLQLKFASRSGQRVGGSARVSSAAAGSPAPALDCACSCADGLWQPLDSSDTATRAPPPPRQRPRMHSAPSPQNATSAVPHPSLNAGKPSLCTVCHRLRLAPLRRLPLAAAGPHAAASSSCWQEARARSAQPQQCGCQPDAERPWGPGAVSYKAVGFGFAHASCLDGLQEAGRRGRAIASAF